jgi:hypothetical protein
MYKTTRNNTDGTTLMICNDCGHAVSLNKLCEKPLQSATDMLKHMAAHNASRAFAPFEPVRQPKPEVITTSELPIAFTEPTDHWLTAVLESAN